MLGFEDYFGVTIQCNQTDFEWFHFLKLSQDFRVFLNPVCLLTSCALHYKKSNTDKVHTVHSV